MFFQNASRRQQVGRDALFCSIGQRQNDSRWEGGTVSASDIRSAEFDMQNTGCMLTVTGCKFSSAYDAHVIKDICSPALPSQGTRLKPAAAFP